MFLKHHIEDVDIAHIGILPTFFALAKTTCDTIIASECHFPLSCGTIMTLQVFRFGLLSSPVMVCSKMVKTPAPSSLILLSSLVSLANQTDCHKFLLLRSDFGHICYRLGSIREQCTTPANRPAGSSTHLLCDQQNPLTMGGYSRSGTFLSHILQ